MPHTTRRTFLQATAAASTLALAGTKLAAEDADDEPRYKKAVKITMVKVEGSLTEKFKLLKSLGYDGVELKAPSGPTADEVKRAIDETGLPVHGVVNGVHWRQRLSDPDPEVRAVGLSALQQTIRDSKAYGGTSTLLVPGKVVDDVTYEQCWERSIAEIKKAVPLAEELGVEILIENVWNDFLTDPKETVRYLEEIDSKMVGAYFDVGNAVRYSPPETWIPILGKRIRKLDIKDFSAKDQFRPKLTEGDVNWPKVIDALEAIGYRGWGTAEVAGGDKDRLADIAARMDKIFAS